MIPIERPDAPHLQGGVKQKQTALGLHGITTPDNKIEASLATKLRLAVSSAIKPHAGKLNERGGVRDPLIGGRA